MSGEGRLDQDAVGGGARLDWRTVVVLLALAFALHVLTWVLLPFVMAAILSFICEPLVRSLQRRTRQPRWLAAVEVWLVLFSLGVAAGVAGGLEAAHQLSRLGLNGSDPLRAALSRLLGPGGLRVLGLHLSADQAADGLEAHLKSGLLLAPAARLGGLLLAAAASGVLFAAASFYMMLSGPTLARGAIWLVPPSQRGALERVLPSMLTVFRRFYVGVLVIVVFTAVMVWLGYGLVLHVPGAPLLAVVLGVMETVPAVGPLISACLVTVLALQLHSLAAMALMVGYGMTLRFVIDDVVAPPVLGRSVAVHPVVVMLSYALGGVLFGVTGLLLAVPAAACTRIWLEAAYGDKAGAATPASTE